MVKVLVNAKINLSLKVLGEQDGYHLLNSVVASVNVSDVISASKSKSLSVTFKSGSKREITNAYKVAEFMVEQYALPGVEITIDDTIPSGCGLGASSADCSAVIVALNELYSLGLDLEKMREIALKFGSDTAYMLTGGFAVLEGRGEKITPFKSNFTAPITIAYRGDVSTKQCFMLFDALPKSNKPYDIDALPKMLESGNYAGIYPYLENDLSYPAGHLNPFIAEISEIALPYHTVMTGSGAGVVIFARKDSLTEALINKGYKTIETEIADSGLRVIRD